MTGAADTGPFHVLLVEDNPADAELTREALTAQRDDLVVDFATDGFEALDYLQRRAEANMQLPDLVILDLNMPRMSGKDFLADVRQDARFRALPIIVLTTSAAEEDIHQSYALGANSFVNKPMEFNQFEEAVQLMQNFWFSLARLPSKARKDDAQ